MKPRALVALTSALVVAGAALSACGSSGTSYASPLAMAQAMAAHGITCTTLVTLPAELSGPGVAQAAKCQVVRAAGLASADLDVTGGIDVTLFVLQPGTDGSVMADQFFQVGKTEAAYGPNWVAEGSASVFLNLGKALGGSYPADEQADLSPT